MDLPEKAGAVLRVITQVRTNGVSRLNDFFRRFPEARLDLPEKAVILENDEKVKKSNNLVRSKLRNDP